MGKIEDVVFRKAVENDYAKVVALLLKDRRVNPGADDNYAIKFAERNGHIKIVKMLVETL